MQIDVEQSHNSHYPIMVGFRGETARMILTVEDAIALQSDLTLAIAAASEKPRAVVDVERLDREPMTRDEIAAFSSEVVRQLHPDAVWSDDGEKAAGGVAARASEKPTPAPE